MGVRLITGRAGSGKTHWCQSRVCDALASSLAEGPRLIMLVPEQAGLQMERALLAMSAAAVLGRCEVLSFRRLAHRVLGEATGPMPATLSPTGRQMALRYLIGRHRNVLREFGKVAERGGFVAAIARGIAELLQESVTAEQLQAAADTAEEAGDPSAPRLHDAALLYGAYLAYLGSERVDPEGVLDLARARLGSAAWLDGARIWIDGFAGLTQQQVRMITALAERASHVDVALLLDPTRGRGRGPDSAPDDLSLFARTERTWFALGRALHEAGVPIGEPVLPGGSGCPRFAGAEVLARLERGFFAVPTERDDADNGDVRPPLSERAGHPTPNTCDNSPRRKPWVVDGSAEGTGSKLPVAPDTCTAEHSVSASGVRLVKAPDRRAEVAAAIRMLVDLVQRPDDPMRYRDVAVVVRDLAPYHDLISARLRAHGIPFFIDRRRPTHHHPLVQLVRGALAMQSDGPFDQAVVMLLKSGLSGLDDEAADALENYLLAHGLMAAEAWDEPWTYSVTGAGEDTGQRVDRCHPRGTKGGAESSTVQHSLEEVNLFRKQLRDRMGEWWPAAAGKRGRPACRKWAKRLYTLLERLGAADGLVLWCDEAVARGDLDEAEEHRQVWSDLVKLLDELVETLGDERMTGRQFRDVLEAGLSEFTLGLVPATLDQVLVSSIERSRHPPVRAVFVLGFEDGQFPAPLTEDTILGDEERQHLQRCNAKLGRTRAQQLLDERMLAYVAVTRPSSFLWISYSESNEAGKQTSPSPYWPMLRAALPDVPVETAEATGPGAIGTVGELAAGLAAHMRTWCEQGTDGQDNAIGVHPETTVARASRPCIHRRDGGATSSLEHASGRESLPASSSENRGASASRRSMSYSDTWLTLYDWTRSETAVTASVRAALAALSPPVEAGLSASATAALLPVPHRTSVTRLEQFAQCPFQHFAARGLCLEPRAVHEISALDMGSLYHTILEQLVNELMETGRSLRDMAASEIAGSLSHWCQLAVADYARGVRMEEQEQKKAVWRSGVELPAALTGEQTAIGKSPLQPVATEKSFGGGAEGVLPALVLRMQDGRTVSVRGKIDRVDVMQSGDASLAVVLDYKRSIHRRLRLDEVYHGLALQLLAYLLVIRDQGRRLTGVELIPGGAFYLPLLASYEKVAHPAEADEEAFNAYKDYKPRGVVDFDWIDRLDPTLESGRSSMFAVYRKKDGAMGHVDTTDAVAGGAMPALLEHVRRKMTELAEDWISGNVAVAPARLGNSLPCSYCLYRSVCRYEFAAKQARPLARMSRGQVLDELATQMGGCDG